MKTQLATGLILLAALTLFAGLRAASAASVSAAQMSAQQDKAQSNQQQAAAQRRQQADLQQQQYDQNMQQASQKMQAAAQQMAQAALQMQGPMMARMAHMFDPNRAVLGVSIADNGHSAGVRVEAVTPGGPADQAGVHAGDVITAINGQTFKSTPRVSAADQLMDFMDKVKPDDTLKLSYERAGQSRNTTLKAGRLSDYSFVMHVPTPPTPPVPPLPPTPPVPPAAPANLRALFAPGWWGSWGNMQLVQLTPGLGQYFGTDKGLLVVRAPRDTALKLEDGDVILKIGERTPATPSEAMRILYSYSAGESFTLHVLRKRKPLVLSVVAPKNSRPAFGPYDPMSMQDLE